MKAALLFVFIFSVTINHAQPIIVKNDAVQVLYVGAENPITVHVNRYKPSQLKVKPSIGQISKLNNNGSYMWKICDGKDSASLSVYCSKQLIKKFWFPLKHLANPTVSVGPGVASRMPVSIASYKGISVRYPDWPMPGTRCNILSYHFTISRKHSIENEAFGDTLINEAFVVGPYFTPRVKKLMSDSKEGDVIVIDKIFVQVGCEPQPREAPPMAFYNY